jgi:hypothetical protein
MIESGQGYATHGSIQPLPLAFHHFGPSVLCPRHCGPEETELSRDFLAELFSWLDRSGLGRHPDMGSDAGPSPGASNRQQPRSGVGPLLWLRKVFTAWREIL